jgi:KDO2-lipid IV(A) lauroyltransferase
VREILRALRERMAVGIVIDQDARSDGVFVPFFGQQASTTPTLALLALRTDAPVLPIRCLPLPRGRYRVTYGPELEIERTDDRHRDVERLTARCTSIIEHWVRENPEYWLWMHRRWKTQPPAVDGRR